MAELGDFELDNVTITIPHAFESDLNCVVVANYRFAIEGISRAEAAEIEHLQEDLAQEGYETVSCAVSQTASEYEELRNAATQLALVGVVTRLQHWINRFVKMLPGKPSKISDSQLINQLAFLDNSLGCDPTPQSFFEAIVDVRDSIVHADSQAQWIHGKKRGVLRCYSNTRGEVELSERQLQEIVDTAIKQVLCYDEKLKTPGCPHAPASSLQTGIARVRNTST